jgi:uncharacterized protein (DUF1778 family)
MARRTDSTTHRNAKASIQLRLPPAMKKLLHCCAIVHETTLERFTTTALRQALQALPESDPAREVAPELWRALMSDAQGT